MHASRLRLEIAGKRYACLVFCCSKATPISQRRSTDMLKSGLHNNSLSCVFYVEGELIEVGVLRRGEGERESESGGKRVCVSGSGLAERRCIQYN